MTHTGGSTMNTQTNSPRATSDLQGRSMMSTIAVVLLSVVLYSVTDHVAIYRLRATSASCFDCVAVVVLTHYDADRSTCRTICPRTCVPV